MKNHRMVRCLAVEEAFARKISGSSPPSRSILKSVSFHDRTHGTDGSEMSDLSLDGLDNDTMTSEGKAQKAAKTTKGQASPS